MQTKFYLLIFAAAAIGFTGGFLLANGLNRSEIAELNAKLVSLPAATADPNKKPVTDLSDAEIEKSISDAESRSDDFMFQKRLGLALYSYAASNNDEKRLDDVEVLLNRASKLKPDDFDVLLALANLNYDLGRLAKDQSRFEKSQQLYNKALEKQPDNLRVLTDLAVTHLDSDPPDPKRALELLDKAYSIDRRNESVLLYRIRAFIARNEMPKAAESLKELKKVNPANAAVKEFEAKMGEEKNK